MFQKEYGIGGEYANCVKHTFDGGIVVAGTTGSPTDILLMKTDLLGNVLWARSYGGAADDNVLSLVQTADSGFVMVGTTSSFGQGGEDVYLVKTDKDGNEQFSKTYGGPLDDQGTYVGQLPDGGFMIAGQTSSYGAGVQDCYVIRTTADGAMLWAKTYGGDNTDEAYSARLTSDGGLVMVGETWTYVGSGEFTAYIAKVDSDGNLKWGYGIGFNGSTDAGEAFDVAATADGGCVVSAEPEYALSSNSNGDFALLKFDANGNLVWTQPIKGWHGWEFGYSIQQMPDSGFIVAGVRGFISSQRPRAVLYRTDKNGNSLWYKSYGDTLNNNRDAEAIDITSDGGFVMAGYIFDTMLGYNGQKIYVIKTDSLGNTGYCNESNDAPPSGPANITLRPGGVQGAGGVEGSPATITTLLFMLDTTLPCGPVIADCPTAAFSFTTVCAGDSTAFTDLSADPAGANHLAAWIWDYADGLKDTFNTSVNPKHRYAAAGAYPAKLRVINHGLCSDSTTKLVTVSTSARAGTVALLPDTICLNAPVAISTARDTGAIQWQSSLTGSNFADIAGAVNASFTDTPQQSLYYRVVALLGSCVDTSQAMQVLVNPLPAPPVVMAADTIICSGDTARVCASGQYKSYLWNTSDTTSCTTATSAGGYWLTVTDANHCSAVSGHRLINTYPVPSVSIIRQGDTLSSFGQVSYQWIRNNVPIDSATGSFYVAHQSGLYAVQVTDSNGCTTTSEALSITVGISDLMEENITVYPNPSVDNWQLTVDNALLGSSMEIYDEQGRLVFQSLIFNLQSVISLPRISPGIYYLHISSNKVSIVKKLIKL